MKIRLVLLMFWFSLASFSQSAEKLYQQGKALYDAKDYAGAVVKLKIAAEKGHRKAQYRLGYCLDKGKGVTEDDAAAFSWYSKAAAQNHAKAQYQLGRCYKKGEGTKVNLEKAVLYFTKSARQDNADAQYALAKCYLKGQGVAKDIAKAKSWLKKSIGNEKGGDDILKKLQKEAKEGDTEAKELLSLIGRK